MYNQDEIQDIHDRLHSVRNRANIARHLINTGCDSEWLPTLLEDNFEDMQYLVSKYCVVDV